MIKQKIYAQHSENKVWMNDLLFFQDEIKVMKRRLSEIAARNTAQDVMAQVEHFQNLFICQKEVIDKLRHDLPDSRNKVESIFHSLRQMNEESNWESSTEGLEGRMDTFRRIYIEIKQDFHRFEADWY